MEETVKNKVPRCKQQECPVAVVGLCLEGLPKAECPHIYFIDESEVEQEPLNDNLNTDNKKRISLFSGDEIVQEQLNTITYSNPTKLIVIMGEPNSGKTTLLASLFDLFQQGPFNNYWFAGSLTQIGFEKRCHLARLSSGRIIPDTERTNSNDFSFLHLCIRKEPFNSPASHLIFTDVSGERFRLARDNAQEMEELSILELADRVFYIIDGEQLIDNVNLQIAKANATILLSRVEQSSVLPSRIGVDLLITKWDKIKNNKKEHIVEKLFIKPLLLKFKSLLQTVTPVCARPLDDDTIDNGFGYEPFLDMCVTTQDISEEDYFEYGEDYPINREFTRFNNI